MDQPMVSVWLITYNHESYITEAIEGVLMQVTDFPVELIIGEDYSSDRTRAIVEAYKHRYTDRITLFLAERNMGMLPVLRPTYSLCRGKYVAMLDGDDYWTDPLKLQKQVDQLEKNPTARFSFHKVSVLNASSGRLDEAPDPFENGQPNELFLEDFLRCGNPVYTLSVLFRNDLGALPDWYYKLPYPDLALYYLLLMHGGVAQYLSDNMGVYRVHRTGSFSSLTVQRRYESGLQFFELVKPHLPGRYHHLLEHGLQHHHYELFLLALKKLRVSDARKHLLPLSTRQNQTTIHHPRWHHNLLLISLQYVGRMLLRLRSSIKPV
jgi:glycosyltransferase involved in cell wall biosynthesis